MTTEFVAQWGLRYDLTLSQVVLLRKIIHERVRFATNYCNGEPHPIVHDRTDKAACSDAWWVDVERIDATLLALAKRLGFDDVDFQDDRCPALIKGQETGIMVP